MTCRAGGSISLEVAILAPVFLLLIVMAIVAGRTAIAYNSIDLAAHDGARAASLARDASGAREAAVTAAVDSLSRQGLRCVNDVAGDIVVDPSGFALPVDSLDLGFVSVTVTCEVSFADVAMVNVPATRELTSTFVSPLDTFRERS